MEPDLASANRPRSTNWQRVHCNGCKGIRCGPQIPGFDQANASTGRVVQPPSTRVVRNAVSERFSLSVRLDKVRQRIRLHRNLLSRRSPYRCRFLQGEDLKSAEESNCRMA